MNKRDKKLVEEAREKMSPEEFIDWYMYNYSLEGVRQQYREAWEPIKEIYLETLTKAFSPIVKFLERLLGHK
jgi:hypothetical protein